MTSILDAAAAPQHSATYDEDCPELHDEKISEGDSDSDGPDDDYSNAESDSEKSVEDNEEDSLRYV
jgi:hypothetical protein